MPKQCSAPGYRRDYRGKSYSPVFKDPATLQVLGDQRLNGLNRENNETLEHIYVCT